jgi:uncharacterized protein with beta-barrel porin domain
VRWRRLGLAGLGWLLAAASGHAQSSLWNSYQGSGQVQLDYAPPTGSQDVHLHFLGAALSTGALPGSLSISSATNNDMKSTSWTVDTGSEGMVITADYLKNTFGINANQFNKPSNQTITYTSSGYTYTGFYQDLNVGLYSSDKNGNGTLVATAAQMPVFIAMCYSASKYCPKYAPVSTSPSLEQMGVGFGRGYPTDYPLQAGAPPRADTDPLLNLTSVTGGNIQTIAPGYVVTASSLLLGLTSAQLANTTFVKLLPIPISGESGGSAYQIAATASDWQTPAMTLGIANAKVNGIYYGSILVDTGLQNIELQTGSAAAPGLTYNAQNPAQSSALQVYLPGLSSSSGQPLSYTLLYQGDCTGASDTCPSPRSYPNPIGLSPIYPSNTNNTTSGIAFVGAPSPVPAFMNTGVNFLNYFNIVFDPVSGFIGYQVSADAQQSQNDPQAIAAIALQGSVAIPAGTTITLPTFLFEEFAQGATPLTNAQLSSTGQVTMAGPISSALYCLSTLCTATGLEIAGGTFILTANNSYLGGTFVDPGATLALSGAGSIAASSGVTANGVFDISATTAGASVVALSGGGTVNLGGQALTIANASGTFGGVIADGGLAAGAGGRLVIAGGMQILTGVNTYTGGTTVTGGATLAINADAALGRATAPLTLNDGTLLALGTVATVRPITVQSGGGTIDAGDFTVSLGGPLTVNGPFDTMGTVLLDANAAINGTMTVSGGLFSDNGVLTAGGVIVAPGATLRGTGVIDAPTTVAGTLAPGNSPGTLTFTAPVTILPGSTTQFDIDGTGTGTGAGNYSRVLVTGAGNSFTAAGTLTPLLRGITGSATNAYTPPLGQGYVVLAAQGGIQGSYGSVVQPAGLAAGTRFDALYSPTMLALVVTPQQYGALGLAGIPESANQSAVGSALDAARPVAGVAMTAAQAALYAPLYPLSASALPGALDALTPAIDADAMMIWRDAWYLVTGAIGGAMETRRGGQPDSQEQSAEGPKGSTIWLTALGEFDNVGSADGVPGYSGSTGGVVAGADMPVLPWLTAGGALAFTSPQVSTKNSQTFSGQALQVTAYGSAHQGLFFVDAQLGGLFFQDSTTRPLPVYGVQADGQTSGTGFGGSVRAGAHLPIGAWQLEPSLGLAGVGISRGGFTETQAGAANLTVGSQGLSSIQSVLAARVERRFAVGETMALVPTVRIGWLHEFADTVGTTAASFAGASLAGGGSTFGVDSAPVGRDAALIGLGATLQTGGPVSLYLAYNGAFVQNTNAQTLTGGVSVKW